ncbi:unnamed protein product [Clonostachys rhizophaga]|uniref:NAD-dependent epimerase/dehydratase domain-containing protein n=1 Tax=Clonostachys rhizophaga TaxID=160324 RepID=A0A9N9W3K3_9HYPO|nr:unnamed protein product [Clonostachys rhizophaga]
MPSSVPAPILAPASVVVTGANGFIGQHCIASLLSHGYSVVGTVRSDSKVTQVLATHEKHPNLSVVVVEDICSSASYTSALESTSPAAIFRLAAPFHYNATDFESEMMIPAVRGSTAVLDAAKQLGTVKRVVYASSFASIYDASKDWSPLSYEDGVKASAAAVAYRASKAAGERAAWGWMKENPSVGFGLVSLNPAMVFGPLLPGAMPASLCELNTSNKVIWGVVSAGEDNEVPPTKGPVWVSVKDVALAHIQALQVPEASGQRFLLAAGVYCNQEVADLAREVATKHKSRIPVGRPGAREADTHFAVDASETEKILQIKWQSLRSVLGEVLPQLYEIERNTRQL